MPRNASAAERPPASAAASALAAVFAPTFLRKLDRLQLTVRHSLSTRPGNTPMPRGSQGSGIELESYRTYGPGDDLRHLDWNAYGRLDQLLVKNFRAQREAPLYVFIDVSASMGIPAGDAKLDFAAGLAAALAYVNLRHHDPVCLIALSEDLPRGHLMSRWFRHRQQLPELREFLLALRARGKTALAAGLGNALRTHRATGVAVLLSDFLVEPATVESACSELLARQFTFAAMRLLGAGERDPTRLFRRAELEDAETGRKRFITLNADNAALYQRALTAHLQRLEHACNRRGAAFAVADTSAGLDRALFHELPAVGLLH
jgi:uncharacterized protein (DUF58 family)